MISEPEMLHDFADKLAGVDKGDDFDQVNELQPDLEDEEDMEAAASSSWSPELVKEIVELLENHPDQLYRPLGEGVLQDRL